MVKSSIETIFATGRKAALPGLLAALALAIPAVAAPGASVVPSMTSTHPGGFIFDGSRMWVTDAAQGFCRMDPSGGGGGGTSFNFSNCVVPSTSKVGVQAIIGQP